MTSGYDLRAWMSRLGESSHWSPCAALQRRCDNESRLAYASVTSASSTQKRIGVAYGLAAYSFWGGAPVLWKALSDVSPGELLVNRIVWAFVLLVMLVFTGNRLTSIRTLLRNRRALTMLVLSSLLLATNWLVFIYAMVTDRVLHASLGYFINPLVNVLLGVVFLRERMTTARWSAVAIATLGVLQLAARVDQFPWISLVLAGTFAMYGFTRKTVDAEPLPGMMVEICIMLPFAFGYGVFLEMQGVGHIGHTDLAMHLMLLATGLFTVLPLIWFTNAVRRLTLATIGFLQYIAPTGQFLLAVLVYGEPFESVHLRSFACIWLGLFIFSFDSWREHVRKTR